MKIPDLQKRMAAAFDLIAGSTTTIEKFEHTRTLLQGVHPDLDSALEKCSAALDKIGKIERGELLHLSAEVMPETTDEQKRRKKALLLFIETIRDLRGEITRVRAELAGFDHSSSLHQTKSVARVLTKAKGPLGLVTLAAVVIVVGATVAKKPSFLNMLSGANVPTATSSATTTAFTGQGTNSKAFSYWVKEAGIDFPAGVSGQVIWKIHVHKENVDTFRTGEHIPATGAVVTAELRSATGVKTPLTGTIGTDGWVYWYEPTPTVPTSLYVINVKGDLPWASADQQTTKNQPLASYKPQ